MGAFPDLRHRTGPKSDVHQESSLPARDSHGTLDTLWSGSSKSRDPPGWRSWEGERLQQSLIR
jgi:hypothetical protein